jgi:hypothetical protein
MLTMFKICPNCDFEWHSKDGNFCPACSDDNTSNDEVEFDPSKRGAFGTSRNVKQLNNFYAGVGIVALVLIIYAFVIG